MNTSFIESWRGLKTRTGAIKYLERIAKRPGNETILRFATAVAAEYESLRKETPLAPEKAMEIVNHNDNGILSGYAFSMARALLVRTWKWGREFDNLLNEYYKRELKKLNATTH